jgi:hypothetical protein
MLGDGDLPRALDPVQERFGAIVKTVTLPQSAALSEVYGPSDGRLYLVRPDGYVGFRCKAREAGLLEAYLSNILSL